jgi:hypothetical protein
MRKTTVARLEALEKKDRARLQKELSSLRGARVYIWEIVLAYYLGGLNSDEQTPADEHEPTDALARALKYPSKDAFFIALNKEDKSEIHERFIGSYRRLFAQAGLDFDGTPRSVLFDALVTMVNQLPDQWLNWLRSNLREDCSDPEIAAGSNVPRGLSGDNFF